MHVVIYNPHEAYRKPHLVSDGFVSTLQELCGSDQVEIYDDVRAAKKSIMPSTLWRLYKRQDNPSAVIVLLEALLDYFHVEKASRKWPRGWGNTRKQAMKSFARKFGLAETKRINGAGEYDLLELMRTTQIITPVVFLANDMPTKNFCREYPATREKLSQLKLPVISCLDEGPVQAAKLAFDTLQEQTRNGLPNASAKEVQK